ncbi:MAG: AAA family ATPase [Alphaproteobacteria bacterium]
MATDGAQESGKPEDQSRQISLLADSATHGGETVERIDTHGAIVFLAGDRAYKLKRAVRFSFMDFSTAEKRRAACEREVVLNRRTAPDIYLGLSAIRETDGGLSLGAMDEDPDDAIDWVVVMKRFDQSGLLDRLADKGKLDQPLLIGLAAEIARFHDAEDPVDGGGAAAMRTIVDGNLADLKGQIDDTLLRRLRDGCDARFAVLSPLVDRRAAAGCVRHCHGDLHLGNVCVIDGNPVLFDCIEFNEEFAQIDTLYDLAFLLMDLDHHGETAAANLVLNRYIEARPDEAAGVALLPLFLSIRAQVRAKVSYFGAAAQQDEDKARELRDAGAAFTDDALRYLQTEPPRLVAVGGASGSGKSTLAAALAPHVGSVPGAVHLRSDAIRKRLWGVDDLTRLPAAAYKPAMHRKTYAEMESLADAVLEAGGAVVADATFTHEGSRQRIERIAEAAGVPFTGLWLDAPQEVLEQRVTDRRGDASDATAQIVRRQMTADWGRIDWHRLKSDSDTLSLLGKARALLD